MPDVPLIVIDPGHFHAALVQKEMHPGLSPEVRVVAPLGPDLIDYLTRIAVFNSRPDTPTDWRLTIETGPDFLDGLRQQPPGSIAIFSGRNRGKVERMQMAAAAGLHVLADKPAIIRREDLPRLEAALDAANARRLVFADMMTGRHNTLARLVQRLRADPAVFGEIEPGTRDEPGVALNGVHYLMKMVAGAPNPRPAWYFDITQQGEGLADTAVHHVDRVHETLFPGAALDYRRDIAMLGASRWPTPVSLTHFRQVTGEPGWPDYLAPWIDGDTLNYFCNGRLDYRVRGIHVRLQVRWDWQAARGDDTSQALYRGTRCQLELRQGPEQDYRQELYVVPQAEIAVALERRIATLQDSFPGIAAVREGGEWRVAVPAALRIGHDPAFTAFTRQFLAYVADPAALPRSHTANLLAKYYVTTEAVALSQG